MLVQPENFYLILLLDKIKRLARAFCSSGHASNSLFIPD